MKETRLKQFYNLLDAAMTTHVWEIENSIDDGETVDIFGAPLIAPTKENTFQAIYNEIVNNEHLKFLGKEFIVAEINKYFEIPCYWSKIRNQYELN
ncbi:hypothetical protein [Clostridium minihomine]|uniref:hypothetical protein n=1 Tax=Clostridium minihomine TaxID=2045012 RepID=UPI000C78219F|nr:hypothetical protein [Clostridium minihomine]